MSSNEGRSVVERCLTATIRIVEPGDEIIVICSDRVRPLVEEIVKPVLGKIALNIVRHPPTRTPGAARNAGIRQAKFDRLIFQDIDDVPHKNRRKLCEANLTKPKSIFTGGYNVVYDGAEIGKRSPGVGMDLFFFRTNLFLPASAVYLDKKRFFREDLIMGEDTVFFAGLVLSGFEVVRKSDQLIDYVIVDEKVLSRNGIQGVKNEYAFRAALVCLGIRRRAKAFAIVGGVIVSLLKLLPKTIFLKIYLYSHAR